MMKLPPSLLDVSLSRVEAPAAMEATSLSEDNAVLSLPVLPDAEDVKVEGAVPPLGITVIIVTQLGPALTSSYSDIGSIEGPKRFEFDESRGCVTDLSDKSPPLSRDFTFSNF